jgi:hypothetical protein
MKRDSSFTRNGGGGRADLDSWGMSAQESGPDHPGETVPSNALGRNGRDRPKSTSAEAGLLAVDEFDPFLGDLARPFEAFRALEGVDRGAPFLVVRRRDPVQDVRLPLVREVALLEGLVQRASAHRPS